MNKYKELLGENIWLIEYISSIDGVDSATYNNEWIYAREKKTGSWYKCSIFYKGEEEPEFEKLKSWELEKVLLGEEALIVEADYTMVNYNEDLEGYETNREYVNDDIYEDYSSREGIAW